MADPTIPFKGLFGFETVAVGGNTNDLSSQLVTLSHNADRTKITRGPYLSTNHREDVVGSTAVTVNHTIGKMTTAQMDNFYDDWEAGTLMEFMYFADSSGGVSLADPPVGVAANASIMAQYELVNAPPMPGIQDVETEWEIGDIQAVYFRISDGSTTVENGSAT